MSFLQSLLIAIEPQLVELCAVIVTALIGWLFTILRTHFKMQIEEKHERAIKKAAATGAKAAIRAGFKGLEAKTYMRRHVFESVPDAMAALRPKPLTFDNILESALGDRENAAPAMLINNMASGVNEVAHGELPSGGALR
ncbi:hypothetical protein [Salipiger abyssi]|uniref:Uncharacterized protein n=1 Tax=Salipiger abyssi TaxID=1250539 RepID=A0A1P8UXM6_9RHOB|nr:hypothetical protein [Salipiger abyssi]ALF02120.1 hypothetical protein vBPeaSP1_029 [Pelagibaca phage vB_PeaS-P1]APZ54135.1 hypothetical protein Ga0080574_TMP3801 [Salipiger abyssi]